MKWVRLLSLGWIFLPTWLMAAPLEDWKAWLQSRSGDLLVPNGVQVTCEVLYGPVGWEQARKSNQIRVLVPVRLGRTTKVARLRVERLSDHAIDTLLIRVRAQIRVAMASIRCARGQELQAGQWYFADREWESVPLDAVDEEKQLLNMRLKKIVMKNEILTTHILEPMPDIVAKEVVRVRIQGTGVLLTTEGEAMREGIVGQMVPIKLMETGKILQAKLQTRHCAVVDITERP
jgi:flagella basal body P-ring formation protein FlgA